METMKRDLLELSKVSPNLKYSAKLATQLSKSKDLTRNIIEEYFAHHPKEYLEELAGFEQINGVSIHDDRRAFIFIPAFNEERNLASLVDQYNTQIAQDTLLDPNLYELCFVINYPEYTDFSINAPNVARFEHAIDILLEQKKNYPNIHILPKQFKSNEGSLGRARKYGMDYCLWRVLHHDSEAIDRSAIISNEGDTLEIPRDYIVKYLELFASGNPRFIQGKIEYPVELTAHCEPLRMFTGFREAVHFGQGIASNMFPYFDGIMPIGRNFAVSPRVCAQVGGIDPIRRKDTDDDMNFGTDIHVLLGESIKSVCSIPLITNPRREVTIVRDMVAGRKQDSKKSYENFHENRALYDLSYPEIVEMAKKAIPSVIPNHLIKCELANQYFQWVLISRYKASLSSVEGFNEIIVQHRNHEISYWEKERELCATFEKHLSMLEPNDRRNLEEHLVTDAIDWFNQFVSPLGIQYTCTKDDFKSVLQ